mgnify:CR=1 FL=1
MTNLLATTKKILYWKKKRHASVTDTGTDTMNLVYGAIKQGSKTVRLQMHYKKNV